MLAHYSQLTTTTRRPPSSVCTNVTLPYECRLDHTCLPDYVRCNFVWDCYFGEDEFGCGEFELDE